MSEEAHGGGVYRVIKDPQPKSIVVYCGDPRFQEAFEEFIRNDLRLDRGQYVPLVIGGGAGVLARPTSLPKEFKFVKDRLELYGAKFPSIDRVILINHEDCGYYHTLKDRALGMVNAHLKGHADLPREDLKLLVAIFSRLLSHCHLKVETYFARFTDADKTFVAFERVTPSGC